MKKLNEYPGREITNCCTLMIKKGLHESGRCQGAKVARVEADQPPSDKEALQEDIAVLSSGILVEFQGWES
ncbi:hypothetical protein SNK03_008615 [Fusarium graminearum]